MTEHEKVAVEVLFDDDWPAHVDRWHRKELWGYTPPLVGSVADEFSRRAARRRHERVLDVSFDRIVSSTGSEAGLLIEANVVGYIEPLLGQDSFELDEELYLVAMRRIDRYARHRAAQREFGPSVPTLPRSYAVGEVSEGDRVPSWVMTPPAKQSAVARSDSERRWAEAVGPVYLVDGTAKVLGQSESSVKQMVEFDRVLAIPAGDGALVFPVAQFIARESKVVSGLAALLELLTPSLVDRATLAVWLNLPRQRWDGRTLWALLREHHGDVELPDAVADEVEEYRSTLGRLRNQSTL